MKLEHGDPFEIAQCDWLRSRLPSYEKIWAAFIVLLYRTAFETQAI